MLFNSLEFAIFLPIVFALFWSLRHSLRWQNLLIVAASYLFYGWWDWRFLSLLFVSSLVDYAVGIELGRQEKPLHRKLLLSISLLVNIGLLVFFKYFNFFADSFEAAFTFFGHRIEAERLNVVLPVGISFYSFQTLSYALDIYRRKMAPTRDFTAFLAFVSFFPQLVAGPIERASNLLPQFFYRKTFDPTKAADGLRQMLWGLFKKIVIADNCAQYAEEIFSRHDEYNGAAHLLGAVYFTIQLYCDFSGYSDIAIGSARLFGFDLMRNFTYPHFSRNIVEFWRRWHISLTTWFRDYLYLPLGGNRDGMALTVRNLFIVFLISGLWHGANWTFVVWGLLHALFTLPYLLLNIKPKAEGIVAAGRWLPSLKETLQMGTTFLLVAFALVIFRADSLTHAFAFFQKMFSASLFAAPDIDMHGVNSQLVALLIVLFFGAEWLQRERQHGLDFEGLRLPKPLRWAIYYLLILLIAGVGGAQQQFIYFQF